MVRIKKPKNETIFLFVLGLTFIVYFSYLGYERIRKDLSLLGYIRGSEYIQKTCIQKNDETGINIITFDEYDFTQFYIDMKLLDFNSYQNKYKNNHVSTRNYKLYNSINIGDRVKLIKYCKTGDIYLVGDDSYGHGHLVFDFIFACLDVLGFLAIMRFIIKQSIVF